MDRPDLQVGSIVQAVKQTGVCDVGERGVVYELYRLGDRWGASIVFANGGYDGFSQEEVTRFLRPLGRIDANTATYQFSNVIGLVRDFERGVFDAALATTDG